MTQGYEMARHRFGQRYRLEDWLAIIEGDNASKLADRFQHEATSARARKRPDRERWASEFEAARRQREDQVKRSTALAASQRRASELH